MSNLEFLGSKSEWTDYHNSKVFSLEEAAAEVFNHRNALIGPDANNGDWLIVRPVGEKEEDCG